MFVRELAQAFEGQDELAELPDSVEAVVNARIDSLAPAERTALRTASGARNQLRRRCLAPTRARDRSPRPARFPRRVTAPRSNSAKRSSNMRPTSPCRSGSGGYFIARCPDPRRRWAGHTRRIAVAPRVRGPGLPARVGRLGPCRRDGLGSALATTPKPSRSTGERSLPAGGWATSRRARSPVCGRTSDACTAAPGGSLTPASAYARARRLAGDDIVLRRRAVSQRGRGAPRARRARSRALRWYRQGSAIVDDAASACGPSC